jgi:hypothetical protein
VLRALFERSTALVLEAFSRVASVAAPRERFAALLRESATLVREHREFWRVSYGVRMQHAVVADLSQGIAAQSAAYVGLFTTLLAELGERATPSSRRTSCSRRSTACSSTTCSRPTPSPSTP